MAGTQKLGEAWYIFDDASGICTEVYINDITESTIQLVYADGTKKRFFTEYINFAGKIIPKVLN